MVGWGRTEHIFENRLNAINRSWAASSRVESRRAKRTRDLLLLLLLLFASYGRTLNSEALSVAMSNNCALTLEWAALSQLAPHLSQLLYVCVCVRLKSTLKFINDNGLGKTMDASTLCSSTQDTLINPCHNILLFCHFSRPTSSGCCQYTEALPGALSFLNLQRNNSKHIRWLTDRRTHRRTRASISAAASAKARWLGGPLSLTLSLPLCAHMSGRLVCRPSMIKVLSARSTICFPAASFSQRCRLRD